jgi:hypothetical protein
MSGKRSYRGAGTFGQQNGKPETCSPGTALENKKAE